ncbi:ABC transporter permease [Sphingobacterium suaedae]|uniref:ABC transporter permease n=1 Tax=Sphingobacterium suaedae TaxID=1686402 RepID=A0ABW5KIZ0_9SPHI
MIKIFFKTALRYIQKNKLITTINIVSLAIGISATLVIFLLVQYNYSFDKHLKHGDRTFRLVSEGDNFKFGGVPLPLIRTLQDEATGIETVVPLYKFPNISIKIPKEKSVDFMVFSKQNRLVFTTRHYFDLYTHHWLAGNAASLDKPNTIVLTETDLNRFFPNYSPEDAIGKTIIFADSIAFQVSGVVQPMPRNSDFAFNSFASSATIPIYPSLTDLSNWDQWNSYSDSYQCLVVLTAGTKPAKVEADLSLIVSNHKKEQTDVWNVHSKLQPIADVHFNAAFNYQAVSSATLRNLIILALFLLSLGAINFVNLSTAQSIERAKEIGIRKTLGSSKFMLSFQFLAETAVISFLATLLSIVLLPILLHAFEGFVPEGLTLERAPLQFIAVFLTALWIIVTIIAGSYPAWILTGYVPILALKNQFSKNSNLSRSSWLRKSLTVFQFILAQVFLICVVVVTRQIQYAVQKDMGFRKDAIVNFYIPGNYSNSTQGNILKTKLQAIPEIKAISFGNQSPAFSGWMSSTMNYDQSTDNKPVTLDARNGDDHYLDVYQIPLIAGRNIRLLDSTKEALINEKALTLLNVASPAEAIGKTFNNGETTIVGIMKDFDLASARFDIRPLIYWGNKDGYVMHIALDQQHPENWKIALDKVAIVYKSVFPDDEFEYTFLDDTIAGFYKKERQLSQLLRWAVSLSVLIAGLGLFGLAIFTANQRTKEIGIRKVLGASVLQILMLLLKNLLSLVGIACLVAFPIAWYFMHKWLADFVYRAPIHWSIFALSALGLLFVATAVLLSKTYFSARANPVDSLRDE